MFDHQLFKIKSSLSHIINLFVVLFLILFTNQLIAKEKASKNIIQSECSWSKLSTITNNDKVNKLIQYSDGTVFAATESKGVFLSINNGETWQSYNDDLKNLSVNDLTYNSNGYLFAATDSGVYRRKIGQTLWTRYSIGLTNLNVKSIYSKQFDGLYCGTGDGFFTLDKNTEVWIDSSSGLVNRNIQAVTLTANGYILVGTKGNGIYRKIEPSPFYQKNDGITNYNINSLISYNYTYLLAASDSGLFYSSTSGSTWFRRNSIPFTTFTSFAYNKTTGWLIAGSLGSGIFVSTNNGMNWQPNNNGLSNTNITALTYLANGNLLAGTSNGEIHLLEVCDLPDFYLTLLDPRGGLTYYANESINIKWASFGIDKIHLAYSLDSGMTYTKIADSINATLGQYAWSIPSNIISKKAIVRALSFNTSHQSKTSTFSIIDSNTISLDLTNPKEDDAYFSGNEIDIEWNYENSESITIAFSSDSGATFSAIAENVPSKNKKYKFSLPDITSEKCFVKIIDENYISKTSISGKFAIYNKSDFSLQILTPYSGEQWQINSNQKITWKSIGIDTLSIYLSVDGGNNWTILATNVDAEVEEYTFVVPSSPSETCKVKIISKRFPKDIYSETLGLFSIIGLHLETPNSGNYMAGTILPITWKSIGTNSIRLSYSTDNGNSWNIIIDNYPALSGVYSWNVPKTPSTECSIRIMDTKQSSIYDDSDELFSIKGLKLIAPGVGETLIVGQKYDITWDYLNTEFVNIKFSTNNGITWQTVASNVPANLKKYEWTIPNSPTNEGVISIFDLDNSSFFDRNSKLFKIIGNGIVLLSPNGDEVITAGEPYSINWSSLNSLQLDIYLSLDGGSTYKLIADSVTSTNYTYLWTVDDTSSTEAKIKLIDSYNHSIFDYSEKNFKIRRTNSSYPPPSNWFVNSQTGDNALIVVPYTVNLKIGAREITTGDYITVWFNRGGTLYCGGLIKWAEDENTSISVWGDNQYTELKDGFDNNEKYIYRIWDGQTGTAYFANATYSNNSSSPGYYANNKVSYISSLSTANNLDITLYRSYINLISSNVIPETSDIESIFNDTEDYISYVTDGYGRTYLPSYNVNQIGDWDINNGYLVVTNSNNYSYTMTISGQIVETEDYPLSFVARKWYIIPFLPMYQMKTSEAFNSISSSILLVKDEKGNSYIPGTNTDNISVLYPGEGYKFIARQNVVFTYPNINFYYGGIINQDISEENTEIYNPKYSQTGTSANASIEIQNEKQISGEVAIINSKKEVVGSAIIANPLTSITIWGDNPLTEDIIEGAIEGEELSLIIYDKADNLEKELKVLNIVDLIMGNVIEKFIFANDSYYYLKAEVIEPSSVDDNSNFSIQVYPNPISNSALINFNLVDSQKVSIYLIDYLGRRIKTISIDNFYYNGNKTIEIDLKDIPLGSYNLIIQGNNILETHNIIIAR